VEILVIWALFSLIPAAIASSKGRSALGWWLIGILLSPLLAAIIVALMSNPGVEAQRHAELVAAASGVAVAGSFTPMVRTPPDGLPSWQLPDPSGPTTFVNGNVALTILQRIDDWAQVRGSNGWIGWVDGRKLAALAPPPDDPPRLPT
jgi:ABC-type multidrug transport system permease subunit